MRRTALSLPLLLLAGCGGPSGVPTGNTVAPPAGQSIATTDAAAPAASTPAPASALGDFATRTGELVNPSNVQMVFLYHALAGVPAPIARWTEEDNRVKYASPQDRAPQRATVGAELAATAASVANIGRIKLSTTVGNLPYDPTYGEFRVGVFAPSSSFSFETLGETVSLRFGNAQAAQIWRVPKEQSQATLDLIGADSNFDVQASLRITGVQPEGSAGGTIVADVVDYEITSRRDGRVIAKVKVDGQ